MYFLIYRSEAVNPMPEETLKLLLAQSRERNKTMDITGMLLYFDKKFLQLLEGDEKEVKRLYADICADNRHRNVYTLKEGPAENRLFPGWSMSFRLVSNEDIAKEPAYKDIYKPGSAGASDLVSLFNLLRGKSDPTL
ncbi:BLUF domain-containing protein [Paradesertivirga mongoliensis]|uniref:BLUF domain-containing protein n=1 Tax=Paradesertivirga mongoliensis TaxID=2100740 RepID=A0ABW4ZN65_9SPHI|nr:BLUF domain-containing protein [Pedobacter mongoliensis]